MMENELREESGGVRERSGKREKQMCFDGGLLPP